MEKAANTLKRKADEVEGSDLTDAKPQQSAAVAASSGFTHILQPTPESWTASLPHRTQVVYTADYSYILHRLGVRPGSSIIEAGAGSGSFTHAAARAVFNGYPSQLPEAKRRRLGQVSSFEFHEPRVEKVREELRDHGLEGIVRVNHRDVYNEGFLLADGESPKANAVFLDLPAPWLALKGLVRAPPDGSASPLDPSSPVHICTFSPCLEQVQQTISTLRQLSWVSISMVEVAHRNIAVRREVYTSEAGVGAKNSISVPKDVNESLSRLRAYEERTKLFRESQLQGDAEDSNAPNTKGDSIEDIETGISETPKQSGIATPSQQPSSVPLFKQGRLFHRTESELKTHTSYLVFATLPCEWTEEEERRCREQWPSQGKSTTAPPLKKSKKQLKREQRMEREKARAAADVAEGV